MTQYTIYKKRLFVKDKFISNYQNYEDAEYYLGVLSSHYTLNLIFGFPYYIKKSITDTQP